MPTSDINPSNLFTVLTLSHIMHACNDISFGIGVVEHRWVGFDNTVPRRPFFSFHAEHALLQP